MWEGPGKCKEGWELGTAGGGWSLAWPVGEAPSFSHPVLICCLGEGELGMAGAQWPGKRLTRSRPKAWDRTISCSSFFLMYSAERTIPWGRMNRFVKLPNPVAPVSPFGPRKPGCGGW